MAGPAPKPTKLKKLAGNPGKRRMNAAEPEPRADAGYCPRWLPDEAKREWRRVAPELLRLGLLTVVDVLPLVAYCMAYARWREACDVLEKQGLTFATPNGYEQQRPEVAIANKAMMEMKALAQEFGMTPASRSRVTLPSAKPTDPFEAFLASGEMATAADEAGGADE